MKKLERHEAVALLEKYGWEGLLDGLSVACEFLGSARSRDGDLSGRRLWLARWDKCRDAMRPDAD